MAMSPRILLFSAIGIILYLSLSLYHGHQLKKYPDQEPGAGKGLSARAEEKTWVQVSTTKQVTAGPVQPQGVQEQPEGGSDEAAAPGTYGESRPSPAQEQQPLGEPATAPSDPQVLLSALQAELLRSRTLLRNREEELRQARLVLESVREEQQAAASFRNEGEDPLVATDQLQAELKEARARAAIAEGELERARLKAEAMFRYGQEQSRLLAPSRQEAESLKTILQETRDKLRQAEQQVADLSNREKQLRKELADLRRAGPEAKAPAAPAGGAGGPTPAAERAD